MSEWAASDGRVDVAKVMAKVREKIRGRRDLGLYSEEEVAELAALKLQAFADDAGIDPELLARLMADNNNWNISTDYRIETHRQGYGARLVVLLKKLVRPWVRLYTDHPLSRQAQINLYLHYLCHNLVRELVKLVLELTGSHVEVMSNPHSDPGVSHMRADLTRTFELVFSEGLKQRIIDRPVQIVFREVEGLPKGTVKAVIDAYGERRVLSITNVAFVAVPK